MALNLNYQDFFRSSFLVEYRKLGLSTNDFLSFANSLIGVEILLEIILYLFSSIIGYVMGE